MAKNRQELRGTEAYRVYRRVNLNCTCMAPNQIHIGHVLVQSQSRFFSFFFLAIASIFCVLTCRSCLNSTWYLVQASADHMYLYWYQLLCLTIIPPLVYLFDCLDLGRIVPLIGKRKLYLKQEVRLK